MSFEFFKEKDFLELADIQGNTVGHLQSSDRWESLNLLPPDSVELEIPKTLSGKLRPLRAIVQDGAARYWFRGYQGADVQNPAIREKGQLSIFVLAKDCEALQPGDFFVWQNGLYSFKESMPIQAGGRAIVRKFELFRAADAQAAVIPELLEPLAGERSSSSGGDDRLYY